MLTVEELAAKCAMYEKLIRQTETDRDEWKQLAELYSGQLGEARERARALLESLG